MQINLSFFPSHYLGVTFHFYPSSATASFCTHCSGRGLGKENLKNRTFLGEDFLADDPRETREKYTSVQQRESGGEILTIRMSKGENKRSRERTQSEPAVSKNTCVRVRTGVIWLGSVGSLVQFPAYR